MNDNKSFWRVPAATVAALLIGLGTACDSKESKPVAPAPSPTQGQQASSQEPEVVIPPEHIHQWEGVVNARIAEKADGTRTQTLMLDIGTEQAAIFLHSKREIVGLEIKGDQPVWQLGKRYRITGAQIVHEQVLANIRRDSGFDKAILVTKVELLPQ